MYTINIDYDNLQKKKKITGYLYLVFDFKIILQIKFLYKCIMQESTTKPVFQPTRLLSKQSPSTLHSKALIPFIVSSMHFKLQLTNGNFSKCICRASRIPCDRFFAMALMFYVKFLRKNRM